MIIAYFCNLLLYQMNMKKFQVFLAGSTELETERTIVRNAIAQWNANEDYINGDNATTVVVKTYQNFPTVITYDTGNEPYNVFIREKADLVIFVLAGSIGDKTKMEFEIAYKALNSSKHRPLIMVLSLKGSEDASILEIKKKLKNDDKYYKEYVDGEDLSHKVMDEFYLLLGQTSIVPRRKIFEFVASKKRFVFAFILFVLLSYGTYWSVYKFPHNKAVFQAKEAISFCETNDNPNVCYDRLIKAKKALEKVGFHKGDSIYDKVDNKIDYIKTNY